MNIKLDPFFYQGLAEELISKFKRLNSFIKHAPTIGSYHEEILKSILRRMLPDRYSIKTGFIYLDKTTVSYQIDILIIDECVPEAYFYKEDNFVIVHPNAVVCAIEVKTRLNNNTFRQAIENIAQLGIFQKTAKERKSKPVFGLIFAYTAPRLTPALLDRWYESIKVQDDIHNYPLDIMILNKGDLCLQPINLENNEYGHFYIFEEEKKLQLGSLSRFLLTIIKFAQLRDGKEMNMFEYAYFENQKKLEMCLRFGKGICSNLTKLKKDSV